MTPSFISGINSKHYAPATLDAYEHELPTNQTVHVRLAYSAAGQTASLALTINGAPLGPLPDLVLNTPANSQFTDADDFRVDMFSISSYSSNGDDFNSVLAHGAVDNLEVKASLVPVNRVTGAFTAEGAWQAQFFSHSNWLYTLERTTNLQSWIPVSETRRGNESDMVLQDTNAPATRAFYRVRAD